MKRLIKSSTDSIFNTMGSRIAESINAKQGYKPEDTLYYKTGRYVFFENKPNGVLIRVTMEGDWTYNNSKFSTICPDLDEIVSDNGFRIVRQYKRYSPMKGSTNFYALAESI